MCFHRCTIHEIKQRMSVFALEYPQSDQPFTLWEQTVPVSAFSDNTFTVNSTRSQVSSQPEFGVAFQDTYDGQPSYVV